MPEVTIGSKVYQIACPTFRDSIVITQTQVAGRGDNENGGELMLVTVALATLRGAGVEGKIDHKALADRVNELDRMVGPSISRQKELLDAWQMINALYAPKEKSNDSPLAPPE